MATLFVWYNGKVLHTWHYNWLVTHAGVCFLNNNPPPARALRNVITINLKGGDQSCGWGVGGGTGRQARRPTPSPMLSPTQWHTDVQHSEFGWYCLTGREHEWNPHWSVITINAVVHVVLDQFMSGWIRCEDLGGDSWWQSCDLTWRDKSKTVFKILAVIRHSLFSKYLCTSHNKHPLVKYLSFKKK